jgi:hypothetical protein
VVLPLACRRCHFRGAQEMAPPADVVREIDERSLYAAPFPFDASLDGIQDFFAEVSMAAK